MEVIISSTTGATFIFNERGEYKVAAVAVAALVPLAQSDRLSYVYRRIHCSLCVPFNYSLDLVAAEQQTLPIHEQLRQCPARLPA